eukprot:scaffold8700_cov31-Tisochrysis_lutea.AAC.2
MSWDPLALRGAPGQTSASRSTRISLVVRCLSQHLLGLRLVTSEAQRSIRLREWDLAWCDRYPWLARSSSRMIIESPPLVGHLLAPLSNVHRAHAMVGSRGL